VQPKFHDNWSIGSIFIDNQRKDFFVYNMNYSQRDIRLNIGYFYKKNMTINETTDEINLVLGPKSVTYIIVNNW
jgi:hypothetical protein